MISGLRERIFSIGNSNDFEAVALELFRYQAEFNPVYREFLNGLSIDPVSIEKIHDIPFLPIEFFKSRKVITGNDPYKLIFESSGTTGDMTSRHYVTDPDIYEESFLRTFRFFYGAPEEYFFAALLPSYLERGNSSLVYMVNRLIELSSKNGSSFFSDDHNALIGSIAKARGQGRKTMLLGVTFALFDLAEKFSPDLSGVIVAETGGMKGRRKEMIRGELHAFLTSSFRIDTVHSEYGMTELLSQAWSAGNGVFHCPPWMKIVLREINDPLSVYDETGITGGMNIIDLANINSCSFIATGDLGKILPGGGFEVLGRFDNSDIRGCNLLMQ
jgi:phenylacetate-coenzyme A ligase PaaK-like adenylate-forming protein